MADEVLRRLRGESTQLLGTGVFRHQALHAAIVGLLRQWEVRQRADIGCGRRNDLPPSATLLGTRSGVAIMLVGRDSRDHLRLVVLFARLESCHCHFA